MTVFISIIITIPWELEIHQKASLSDSGVKTKYAISVFDDDDHKWNHLTTNMLMTMMIMNSWEYAERLNFL